MRPLQHLKALTKQQLLASEPPLPADTVGVGRFVARDSTPQLMDGAATVFDLTKIACSPQSRRKPRPLCPRTPPTLIYEMDRHPVWGADNLSCTAPTGSHCHLSSSRRAPRPPFRRPKGCTIRTDDPPWMVPRRPLRQACPIRDTAEARTEDSSTLILPIWHP